MTKKGLIILLISLVTVGCGEYHKILKSTDPELKYQKAVEYFGLKKYVQAQTLFDDIATYYKGTERSQDVLNYIARCYVGQEDYTTAAEYYQLYLRNFPKGRFVVETRYMIGHCYYLNSPDARLDQYETNQAIDYLSQFIDLYPESPYVTEAQKELEEMYDKLAHKELYSAELYYNLGSYLGNNYESCILVSENALKKYPGNTYREEFAWLILQAKYAIVQNSVAEKIEERLRDTEDECYNFLTEYPDSKYKKAAERIQRAVIKDLGPRTEEKD